MPRATIPAAILAAIKSANCGRFAELVRVNDHQGGSTGEVQPPTGTRAGIDSLSPRTIGSTEFVWGIGSFTFDSNPITARVLQRSAIAFKSNGECEVTLTVNISDGLLPEPEMFAGTDVVVSLVQPGTANECPMFRGVCSEVGGDEAAMTMRCVGYLTAFNVSVPRINTGPQCPLKFRGEQCGFTTVAGVLLDGDHTEQTTVTVDDSSPLTPYIGRYFIDETPRPVKLLATPTSTSLTFDSPGFTGTNGEGFVPADCRKTFDDCQTREREHSYGGFRGVSRFADVINTGIFSGTFGPNQEAAGRAHYRDLNSYQAGTYGNRRLELARRFRRSIVPALESSAGIQSIYEELPVQLIYGRLPHKLRLVEAHFLRLSDDGIEDAKDYVVGFYLIGAGEIDNAVRFFTEDRTIVNQANPFRGVPGVDPTFGESIYWRNGTVGLATPYTIADWRTDRIAATQTSNEQGMFLSGNKTDFRSATGTAYNGYAHAIYMVPIGADNDADADQIQQDTNQPSTPDDLPDLYADVSGRKVQKYLSNGDLDGAKEWSDNPVWCLLDFLLDSLYCAGLPADLFRWQYWKTAADRCDELITNAAMTTTCRRGTFLGPTASLVVNNVEAFAPGMTFTNAPFSALTVQQVDIARGVLYCGAGPAIEYELGDEVIGQRKRFVFNMAFTQKLKVLDGVQAFLTACNGHLFYDGAKLGIRCRKGIWGGDPGLIDNDVARKLQEVQRSLQFDRRTSYLNQTNVLDVKHSRAGVVVGTPGLIQLTDADAGGLSLPKPEGVDLPQANTSEQAARLALARYALQHPSPATEGGNNELSSRGFSVKTGPGGIELQTGEYFEVNPSITHETQGVVTQRQRGRISSLQIEPNLQVSISCAPERHIMRLEAYGPAIDLHGDDPQLEFQGTAPSDDPTIAIVVSRSAGPRIEIAITVGNVTDEIPFRSLGMGRFELHGGKTTNFALKPGKPGGAGTMLASFMPWRRNVVWQCPESFFGETVYLQMAWIVNRAQGPDLDFAILSNEVSVTPTKISVTDSQFTPGINMWLDGDFEDARFHSVTAGTLVEEALPRDAADPDSDAGFSNPTNANVVPKTKAYASGTISNVGGTLTTAGHIFKGSLDKVNRQGWIRAVCSLAYASGGKNYGIIRLSYSLDAGVTWVEYQQVSASQYVEVDSPDLGSVPDTSLLWFRIQAFPADNDIDNAATVRLQHASHMTNSGAYSTIGGGLAYLVGDGTNYAEIARPFPGLNPTPGKSIFAADSENVCQLMCRSDETVDHPVEVLLRDTLSGTEYAAMTIPAADIGAAWLTGGYADLFQPSTLVSGMLEAVIRTKSTGGVYVDKAMITRGPYIYQFTDHSDQSSRFFDDAATKRGTFASGGWPGLKRTS